MVQKYNGAKATDDLYADEVLHQASVLFGLRQIEIAANEPKSSAGETVLFFADTANKSCDSQQHRRYEVSRRPNLRGLYVFRNVPFRDTGLLPS